MKPHHRKDDYDELNISRREIVRPSQFRNRVNSGIVKGVVDQLRIPDRLSSSSSSSSSSSQSRSKSKDHSQSKSSSRSHHSKDRRDHERRRHFSEPSDEMVSIEEVSE